MHKEVSVNEKEMVEMINPHMSDKEIFRLNEQFCVKTTQCFDRTFPTGVSSSVYSAPDANGSPKVFHDFISRVGSAAFGTDETLKQLALLYVERGGYRR